MPTRSEAEPAVRRAIERREDTRYDGGLDGSFSLSGGRSTGGARVFACRIDSISAAGMVLVAPVQGDVGERVLVDIEGFGLVRCEIERLRADGFVCRVASADNQKQKLATWVAWLKRRGGRITSDKRQHMRTQPHDGRTTVTLADGTAWRALVRDLSRSGAAVSADIVPEPGTELIVGKVPARVVRALAVGFAVEFDRVLEASEADELVAGFEPMPVTTAMAS